MNGISLKELRWFSTFNDEFLESESVSIWQAVLFILPYFDDDASVSYFEDIQRREVKVCEDLIDDLDKEREAPRKDDKSPNYTNSYTEWDAIGNRLLTEEQINAFLPKLNRSRMRVLKHIEDADTIYQRLKLEIRSSRKKEPTKIELAQDTLRKDFERVLIKRASLDSVFPERLSCKIEKPVYWHNIKILIFHQLDLKDKSKFSYMEFKAGNKILCKIERKNSPFQGKKRTEPNKLFNVLDDFRKEKRTKTREYTDAGYRKAITDLRKLLKKLTGISGDPFYPKTATPEPYMPRFTVQFREAQSKSDKPEHDNKTETYTDEFTGNMLKHDDMQNNY